MGKLYDIYEKLSLDGNLENNARLIYTLVAIETKLKFKYLIEEGDEFNQFWLYESIKGSKGKSEILLQATQQEDGRVSLSIQGLKCIENINNFINYYHKDEHSIFMKYFKYF